MVGSVGRRMAGCDDDDTVVMRRNEMRVSERNHERKFSGRIDFGGWQISHIIGVDILPFFANEILDFNTLLCTYLTQ